MRSCASLTDGAFVPMNEFMDKAGSIVSFVLTEFGEMEFIKRYSEKAAFVRVGVA